VRLKKKGNLSDCNNWRNITLLSLTAKAFSKVILVLFTGNLEKDIRKGQAGFRKERSCSDPISTPRQISEKAKEWNCTVYANFINFEKSFDSSCRETLWRILRHYGIPSRKVNIVGMLYRHRQAQVICGNTLKKPVIFQTADAYCRRSYLSLSIDWVIKSATKDQRGI